MSLPLPTFNPTPATPAELTEMDSRLRALAGVSLADAERTVITFPGRKFDFEGKTFMIRARQVTINAANGASALLENVQFRIDLNSVQDVLIDNIAFRSDGTFDSNNDPVGPRDAIVFESLSAATSDPSIRARISRCAFNGYFDIAIDSKVSSGRPRLAATIDRCLFYDANPGQPNGILVQGGRRLFQFANRGAINISGGGNSLYTLFNNVFIDVWRRSPRVADGNKAFIYNNLLFRWGIGNDDPGDANGANEWVGIETDNRGKAMIQANRFIPYAQKKQPRKTISIGPDTKVDLGAPARQSGITGSGNPIFSPDTTNEFAGANGRPTDVAPTSDRIQTINLSTFYSGPAPVLTPKGDVDWRQIVFDAGPTNFDRPNIKDALLRLIQSCE